MVSEQGGQPVDQYGGSTVEDGIEQFPDALDLGGRLVQWAVLEHVHTRSEVLDHDPIGAGHVDEEGVTAVGNQEPGRVERAWIDGGAEASTAAAAVGCRARARGSRGGSGGVGAVSQRPIGEPGDDTGLVGRQPRAAADLVATTEDRQFVTTPSRAVIRIVGRAWRSCGWPATISGIPAMPGGSDQQAHRSQRTGLTAGQGAA
jgi:hypothetical protein